MEEIRLENINSFDTTLFFILAIFLIILGITLFKVIMWLRKYLRDDK